MSTTTINRKSDNQERNPDGIRHVASNRMSDGTHVSIIRMREATKDQDVLLTQMELSHINSCMECLCAFTALVGHTDENKVMD